MSAKRDKLIEIVKGITPIKHEPLATQVAEEWADKILAEVFPEFAEKQNSESQEYEQIQWAPSGNALDGQPDVVTQFLAPKAGGFSWGYGYGPGQSMIFGSAEGEVEVLPKQWIRRYKSGRVEVLDSIDG